MRTSEFPWNEKTLVFKKKLWVKANEAYYNGTPVMEDREFDALEKVIKKEDPDWVNLKETGAPVADKKTKKKLVKLMPSLSKVYPEGMAKLRAKWEKLGIKDLLVADKLDGSSVQLVYRNKKPVQLITRGDGTYGQDISFLLPYLDFPVLKTGGRDETELRLEAVMKTRTFEKKYAKKYDNPRNLVNGILNRSLRELDQSALSDVDFVVLGVYDLPMEEGLYWAKKQGFKTVSSSVWHHSSDFMEILSDRKRQSLYAIDGLVATSPAQIFEYDSSDRPKWTVALKNNDEEAEAQEARVKQVIWQTSHNGRLNPKLEIEPLKLKGVTIKYVTVHNPQWMLDRGIGPGAVVKIVRSGDVIPKVVGVTKKAIPQMPEVEHYWDGKFIYALLTSNEETDKKIYKFLSVNGVEHIALKTIQRINESEGLGLLDFLYYFVFFKGRINKLKNMGFGPRQIEIFIAEMDKLRKLDLINAMVGSCCWDKGIGERRLKAIQEHFSLTKILKWDYSKVEAELKPLNGFGSAVIDQFYTGLADYKRFHANLIAMGFELTETLTERSKPTKKGKYTGLCATWTGYRDKTQEQQWLEQGGQIVPFSSKTTHLFYKEDGKKSSKVDKAGDRAMTWESFVA